MKRLALALAYCACATSAVAQSRPSTLNMSCGQTAGLVAARGSIVLGTGGYTYERFVSDQRFCLRDETTEPMWVPARDTPQCFVGYRCTDRRGFDRG